MSSWDASRLSETATWSQTVAWMKSGKLSEVEFNKRRVSWEKYNEEREDYFRRIEEERELLDEEDLNQESHVSLAIWEGFDRRSDFIEPEDNSIELMYQHEEELCSKVMDRLTSNRAKQGKEIGVQWVKKISKIRRRDPSFVALLKELYEYRCQVCGTLISSPRLQVPGYVEGHHIKPMGEFDGPDEPENVIIVCPNHHKEIEYGGMKLDLSKLRFLRHEIRQEYVNFHNREIAPS